jgi:molybdopterin-guanine dinucleotide biosynthesis protein A
MLAGLILAGGAGRRMGGAKAMALLAGAPLIAHTARALADAKALAVVGDSEAANAIGAILLHDPPDVARGPLAGVLAGLDWALGIGAQWLVTAPCDAPMLPPDFMVRLAAAARDAKAACVESPAGLEPLLAIWRTDLARVLRAALAGGAHPPAHAFMRGLGAARLALSSEEVMNLNTPGELQRAELLLARR